MRVVVDTNILSALWGPDPGASAIAQRALDHYSVQSTLAIPAPVYAELRAAPGRSEADLDRFLEDTLIEVDWHIPQAAWKLAGSAFASYAARRRKNKLPGPRRILADFVIGTYAQHHGFHLLTLDKGVYRTSFPKLTLIEPSL